MCPLLLTALLNEIDVQWFKEMPKEHKTIKNLTKRVEFGTLESITIERFFQQYIKADGEEKKKYRFFKEGIFTIDLEKNVMRLTSDRDGTGKAFKVIRGVAGVRQRSQESPKFS